MSDRDLYISRELDAAVLAAFDPKPSLTDMRGWADFQLDAVRASALSVALVNGAVAPHHGRQLAVGRRLLDLIARLIEHEEDVATLFRAKAHAARRRA